MNYRLILIIATLLPMAIYYLLLALQPQFLAQHLTFGLPSSIFWGVAVMFWGVLMAIVYVILHQREVGEVEK